MKHHEYEKMADRLRVKVDRFLDWLSEAHGLDTASGFEIYLIGSHARGVVRPGSDIDFLIVGEDYDEVERGRIELGEKGLIPIGFSMFDPTVGVKPGGPDVVFSSRKPEEGILLRGVESYQELRKDLKRKLLGIEGKRVALPAMEEDLREILTRGQLWRKRVRLIRGQPSRCHQNAANLWEQNRERLILVTGYALTRDDGIWRQHSWLYDPVWDRVIETTTRRSLYFGFAMTTDEAEDFLFWNY